MKKLNMEMTEEDETRIAYLKKIYGLTKSTEVVRMCIAHLYKEAIKEDD